MKSEVHLVDCMEFMRSVPDKAYSLAVVDPPYGLNLALNGQFAKYGGKSKWDYLPDANYFTELNRVSKNQIIWGWNYFSDLLPSCKGFIYWNKLNHHPNRADGELAWTSYNTLGKHFDYMWDGNRYGFIGNIQGVGKKSDRIHPTQKPVALYDWIFRNYAKPGDTILDTHMGSQSSRISAYKAGLDFTGCELDPEYFEQGNERFRNFLLKSGTTEPDKAMPGQQINLF
jgi:site-specific DNA-methyltransferase (adenine-specific)